MTRVARRPRISASCDATCPRKPRRPSASTSVAMCERTTCRRSGCSKRARPTSICRRNCAATGLTCSRISTSASHGMNSVARLRPISPRMATGTSTQISTGRFRFVKQRTSRVFRTASGSLVLKPIDTDRSETRFRCCSLRRSVTRSLRVSTNRRALIMTRVTSSGSCCSPGTRAPRSNHRAGVAGTTRGSFC
jgi:hypothetical protein